MVSPGIPKEDKERLGFIHAREPQEALEIAFSLLGRNAKVKGGSPSKRWRNSPGHSFNPKGLSYIANSRLQP
jgi:hypothetical protein